MLQPVDQNARPLRCVYAKRLLQTSAAIEFMRNMNAYVYAEARQDACSNNNSGCNIRIFTDDCV